MFMNLIIILQLIRGEIKETSSALIEARKLLDPSKIPDEQLFAYILKLSNIDVMPPKSSKKVSFKVVESKRGEPISLDLEDLF